jgi:hypothetical protein
VAALAAALRTAKLGCAKGGEMTDFLIQLLPATILGWFWLIPVYKTCRKRGVNPWMWMVLCALPVVNMIAITVFWVTTIMDILDRLNGEKVFE